ncbi:MAG: HlyC/CorC family transporter [Anaerolineae bacterium]|nr:HlyC/CorC family transporter [Anaerolineae bacterium]
MLLAWILAGLFLIFDIFFSFLRAAMVNVRVPQLLELGSDDPKQLEETITFLEKPHLRATLRFLVALTHILLAACVWAICSYKLPDLSFGAIIGILVALLLFILTLEFTIERVPLKNPESWALRLTAVGRFLNIVISPISKTLVWLQGTDHQTQRSLGSVTEDELKTWVEMGEPEGDLEPDERKMIYSIFQFGETLCREIMVPRMEVLALEVKTPLNQAINAFISSGYSRVPVYDDEIDNVVGMLYAKDLLKIHGNTNEKSAIKKFLRKVYFVPESKKVDDLLAEMQANGIHIAVVVDEYGGMAGLVSLEDIVEEIVGEIRDEFDQSEELLVQKISEIEVLFKGRVSLDDFNDALETHLDPDMPDTLGGFFYSELGRVPAEGDRLEVEGWTLTVEEVRGRRVGRIRAQRLQINEMESV